MKIVILTVVAVVLSANFSFGQYNACAAKSEVKEKVSVKKMNEATGRIEIVDEERAVQDKDGFGNAQGNQYDLAIDGAFEGQTVVVIQLYTDESFDFEKPRLALKEKGFSVYRFSGSAPSPEELEKALEKACQLWVISTSSRHLNDKHAEVIQNFFNSGKGVYLWGDNTPYHADLNFLARKLMNVSFEGTYFGDKNVGFKSDSTESGMLKDHLITTGLEYVYEGITISTITDVDKKMKPLIWSTDGQVVAAIYEDQGNRLIIDGGFTRLFYKWDSAGTGRYVKNAAAWLVNYERFGDIVLGK